MAVSAPVAGVPGEVGKAAGDKWGLPVGPGCGKYMESDEEMNVRMVNQRKVRTAGFREGRIWENPPPAAIPIRYYFCCFHHSSSSWRKWVM